MLLKLPCVWAAGVIGFPDRNCNEVPMAWVVKDPDTVGSDLEIELKLAGKLMTFPGVIAMYFEPSI